MAEESIIMGKFPFSELFANGHCAVVVAGLTLLLASSGIGRAAENQGHRASQLKIPIDAQNANLQNATAQNAFDRGDFGRAIAQWRAAAARFEDARDTRQQVLSLANLGAAYQSSGQSEAALAALQEAAQVALRAKDRAGFSLAQNNLGSLYTVSRQPVAALAALRASLEIAETDKDFHTVALALNNLGNLLAVQNRNALAQENYRRSIALANQSGDPLLSARAALNLAGLLLRSADWEAAENWNETGAKTLETPVDSYDKAQLLLSAARNFQVLTASNPARKNDYRTRATDLNNSALKIAERLNNPRLLSLSLGALGEIGETRGETEPAMEITRRARFIAQQNQLPDLLYQWEWQIGRLLRTQGKNDDAIGSYRRAITTLRTVGDCNSLNGNAPHAAFRDAAGPIYYQMADLLLKRTDSLSDPVAIQKGLIEARDTVELLKTAEIGDYFQDDCVTAGLSKVKDIESVLQNTAVVYYIPLPDRLEILLGFETSLKRVTVPIQSNALTARVRRFRLQLERSGTNQYLSNAQGLYDVLLRPIETELAAQNTKTLVFVSDGALRTIPMGALSDGKQFVVEKFGVALTPGLTLMDPHPLSGGEAQVFAGGVSEAVQGFEALTNVPAELAHIERDYDTKPRLNQSFRKAAVEKEIADGQYSIVHIASHGEFSSNPNDTYLLTYDGKLSMDDLENVIRPHQYQGRPVELLVLSACQTASGDDRAALGLAGAALKSGARSVMASLWSVSDEATSGLVKNFYAELKRDPLQSKAIALQKAQIELLRDERFRHPAFWAPYLIIGNWL